MWSKILSGQRALLLKGVGKPQHQVHVHLPMFWLQGSLGSCPPSSAQSYLGPRSRLPDLSLAEESEGFEAPLEAWPGGILIKCSHSRFQPIKLQREILPQIAIEKMFYTLSFLKVPDYFVIQMSGTFPIPWNSNEIGLNASPSAGTTSVPAYLSGHPGVWLVFLVISGLLNSSVSGSPHSPTRVFLGPIPTLKWRFSPFT